MNPSTPSPDAAPPPSSGDAAAPAPSAPLPAAVALPRHNNSLWILGAVVLTALCVASLALVWSTQQRVKVLEQELVRRQQGSQDQATEARVLASQAHDIAADAAARLGLVEARVAESSLQRTQVEELMQSMSRSRDENVVADVEASIRVALQQSAITGSAEPLVTVLKQGDERLARYNQPRLERVRRAMARDLDRVRATQTVDVPGLSMRLDEIVRRVDDLPLLMAPERHRGVAPHAQGKAAQAVPAASAASAGFPVWQPLNQLAGDAWAAVRSLLRVTRIDHPEAGLMAPDQAYFLRENLKLRLLNARLSLLSRQFDLAQGDLNQAQAMLDRFFDSSSPRVALAREQLRQLTQQARQVVLPRPDETLAALAAAGAGR